jgi:Skp family chaperone for outer membrane proteins
MILRQEDHGSREGGGATRAEQELQEKKKQLKDASYLRAISTAQKSSRKLLETLENVFEVNSQHLRVPALLLHFILVKSR